MLRVYIVLLTIPKQWQMLYTALYLPFCFTILPKQLGYISALLLLRTPLLSTAGLCAL